MDESRTLDDERPNLGRRFGLPLVWPEDPVALSEREQAVSGILALMNAHCDKVMAAVTMEPRYGSATARTISALVPALRQHWPVGERPAVVAEFLERFGGTHGSDPVAV